MTAIARHAFVHGRVQGVAFRYYTKARARELGVFGWVRNRADGSVEVWIEGAPEQVLEMLAWLDHGPPTAEVVRVDIEPAEPVGLERFEVTRA